MKNNLKKLNKSEKVAIFVAVAFVAFYMISPLFHLTERFVNLPEQDLIIKNSDSDLVIQDLALGNGALAELGDTLMVEYNGSLLDGTTFDSNVGSAPFSFTMGAGQVIEGWERGFVGMREGGFRLLVVPPELGYGEFQAGIIPPDSTLIFEIKLLKVLKGESL